MVRLFFITFAETTKFRKMKKLFSLIFIVCALAFANDVNAQVLQGTDTITDADGATVSFTPNGGNVTASVQIVVNKLSGTVAGNCWLGYSLDGAVYEAGTDTLTLTDAALNTKVWVITPNPYPYISCACEGSGTQSAQIQVYSFKRDRR